MSNRQQGQTGAKALGSHTDTDIRNSLFHCAIEAELALACWRAPGQQHKHLIIDLSGSAARVEPDIDALPEGFLFAPFQPRQPDDQQFIKADIHFCTAVDGLQLSPQQGTAGHKISTEDFESRFEEALTQQQEARHYHHGPKPKQQAGTSEQHYTSMVTKAIAEINQGSFEKVVPARTKYVSLPPAFNLLGLFDEIAAAYPNAFVSIVSIPGVGTWLGATPETLISMSKEGVFKTVALAGTQPYHEGTDLREVAWRQKEIEEQALVARYIINCFKKIRLREFAEKGPATIIAANLMHLKTTFEVDTQAVNFPELPEVMLKLLHPTSAVCGMPKEQALDFLLAQEDFDRGYFAGYLGPVHIQGSTSLFVNLRCTRLLETEAVLYAGAGVTADSDPQKEWHETGQKCQTLLRFLSSGELNS